MLWTVGLVFAVAFATQVLSAGPIDVFHTSMSTIQAAVNAGIAAVVALGINAAMPFIKQYGVNAE